jgi:hypothetical protein
MPTSNVENAILVDLQKSPNRDTPFLKKVQQDNQIVLHNYSITTKKHVCCALEGCSNKHTLFLIPNQILYPKYCEQHRTPFRRNLFLQDKESSGEL